MTVKRMDHVGVVVDDLEAATAFFVELGLRVVGETSVEGDWVDRIIGLDGARSRIAMLETPDGHSRLELTAFDAPPSPPGDPRAPSNAPGIRHLLFAVDDLDDTLARLRSHGAELVGEVVNYSDRYLMCYLRGPGGIIVELAEELG
jgi:catechol 2,3-dioxygenase-like lactoylglutathione lyase family enzyme